MFTGLVEETGVLETVQASREGALLALRARLVTGDLQVGDSVAVNGVCLTATAVAPGRFEAAVMPETLRKTTLGKLSPGAPVNLERALALGGRLGGHLVTGHIDGVGTVAARRREGNALLFHFRAPPEVLRYVIPKGSIAVDGVSLTVAAVEGERFSVSLVPHTAAQTSLGRLEPGDAVNLEADLIGKYVEKLLQPRAAEGKITMSLLQEKGFL